MVERVLVLLRAMLEEAVEDDVLVRPDAAGRGSGL